MKLFDLIQQLNELMKDNSYFFYDKKTKEFILNGVVCEFDENEKMVYRITNASPSDLGFITSVSKNSECAN